MTAGFSCKSRSKANAKSSANLGCVREGTGEAGTTFAFLRDFVHRERPSLVILENVCELSEGGDASDTRYVCQTFEALEYACSAFEVEALEYGSLARRSRLYFVAFAGIQNACRLATLRSTLNDMQLADNRFTAAHFLEPSLNGADSVCSEQGHA